MSWQVERRKTISNFDLMIEQLVEAKAVINELDDGGTYRFAIDFDVLDEFLSCRSVEEAIDYLQG